MTSIKVKFRPSTVAGKEGTIYYQMIHERKSRQILTDYHLLPSEWDEKRSTVNQARIDGRNPHLRSIRERINRDKERFSSIIRNLDNKRLSYTIDDVIDEFNRYDTDYTLFNFMGRIIEQLQHNGKTRTSETYRAALKSFRKFRQDKDIRLDCLDTEIMGNYEAWHHSRGICPNTISFYTRILRATYNRAVEEGIIEDSKPFRHVYTGVDKTVKRALPLPVIKKIKTLDLSYNASLEYARDIFIMSFMLRGMSFIDMAYLRKSDLKNGYVIYRRRKTGQRLIIEWTKEMQEILDRYPENMSEYLLPIIKRADTNELYTYRNASYNINHNLKTIAKEIGLTVPLTLYVARHSWASAAKAKGIPLSVISEGMGHDSETTTQIYLASLDTNLVDQANSLILSSL